MSDMGPEIQITSEDIAKADQAREAAERQRNEDVKSTFNTVVRIINSEPVSDEDLLNAVKTVGKYGPIDQFNEPYLENHQAYLDENGHESLKAPNSLYDLFHPESTLLTEIAKRYENLTRPNQPQS